jgi:hypothetical protein
MPAVLLRAIMFAMAMPAIPGGANDLESPVPVMADGQAIDLGSTGGAMAAPCYADFDGDGVKELLVGGTGGTVRIYRNHGTNAKPQFKEYTWFKVGADLGRVPCT